MSQNRELEELKANKEAIEKSRDKDTPLDAIRFKELEIKRNLMEAQKKAEEDVAESRREAIQIKERAKNDGIEEGKAVYKKEIEAAQKKAEEIRKTGLKEAQSIWQKGLTNLDKAVNKIVELVVPGNEKR